ncbi:unnamed protein product [Ambrosiozyma monospora]|uniref:Unnamed protein product n=1 Tax=Ambrosiozyma monospora TaxID=43982 RepID=A0ACB5TCU1_AMBMO|nr:unnamed protein product [Ambrosiozyma monospora]
MIYLDTTFNYRSSNPNIKNNFSSIESLLQQIEMYPPQTHFLLPDIVSGFEDVWCRINDRFGDSCVFLFGSGDVKRRFDSLKTGANEKSVEELNYKPNYSFWPFVKKINGQTHQFWNGAGVKYESGNVEPTYYFHLHKGPPGCVFIRYYINVDDFSFDYICSPKTQQQLIQENAIISAIPKGDQDKDVVFFDRISKNRTDLSSASVSVGDHFEVIRTHNGNQFSRQYVRNSDGVYLPKTIRLIYSRHSSCEETIKFVMMFNGNVKDVYPITESVKTWKKLGFSVARYYGKLCRAGKGNGTFAYDSEMFERFGYCCIDSDEPVKICLNWPVKVPFEHYFSDVLNADDSS